MSVQQEELLRRAKAGDRDAGEALVVGNSGLIWSIARRYFGRGVDPEDLFQLGCLGFLKAVEGFDLDFGTQFSTYAVPKIAGEIRRFLRDDGTVKVSRSLKERAMMIRVTRQKLTNRLGREPTLSELSVETGLQPEEIATAETATGTAESIQKRSGEDGFALEDVLTEGEMEEKIVERIALRCASPWRMSAVSLQCAPAERRRWRWERIQMCSRSARRRRASGCCCGR